MNILITLILIIIAVVITWHVASRAAKQNQTTTKEEIAGICSVAIDQTFKKNTNKAKIIELFASKPKLTNADIRQALGLSRRSVTRYLNQLEDEGKIRQEGKSGRFVTYRLI